MLAGRAHRFWRLQAWAVPGCAVLIALPVIAANAVELCVTCEGPAAHYTCTFNEPNAQATDPRLKLLCITELAKSGGHQSCSVDRTAQQAACGGTVRVMALPAGEPPSPPAQAKPAQAPASAPAGTPPPAADTTGKRAEPAADAAKAATNAPASDAPPKTVQEMLQKSTASAGKTLEKTGEAAAEGAKSTGTALENAGKAVGNAAAKTWKCLTSLFGDC